MEKGSDIDLKTALVNDIARKGDSITDRDSTAMDSVCCARVIFSDYQ